MKKKILLVEDEALIALAEKELLEGQGYEVDSAADGSEALEKADADPEINLILMDIDLGRGMSGTEAAQKILEKHDLPIVFLTSHTEPGIVDQTEGITSYGYILKNSGDVVLLASVKMAFRLYEAQKKLQLSEDRLQKAMTASSDGLWDWDIAAGHVFFDTRYYTMAGYEDGEFPHCYEEWEKRIHPEDLEKSREMIGATLSGETAKFDMKFRFRRKDDSWMWIRGRGKVMERNEKGEALRMVGTHSDISDYEKVAEELEMQRSFFNGIIENMPNMVFLKEAETLKFFLVNKAAEELMGLKREELIGRDDYEIFPEHEADFFRKMDLQAIKTRKEIIIEEEELTSASGLRYVYTKKVPFLDETGKPKYLLGITEDITELKKALEEKSFLMRELQHRVKNNLMMIKSLISLKNADLAGVADLTSLIHQIDAISIIYEKLYKSQTISRVDLKDYIQSLLETVFSFSSKPVEIRNRIKARKAPAGTAASLGLIINELATNSIKYGFADDRPAIFTVDLKEDKRKGENRLMISNNGKPFPEDIDFENPATQGMRLISALAGQIGGSIELRKEPSPLFTIRFPTAGRGPQPIP